MHEYHLPFLRKSRQPPAGLLASSSSSEGDPKSFNSMEVPAAWFLLSLSLGVVGWKDIYHFVYQLHEVHEFTH